MEAVVKMGKMKKEIGNQYSMLLPEMLHFVLPWAGEPI